MLQNSPLKYIYLDSNFWIDLGDGIRNGFPETNIENFYYLLRELIYSGKAICPISNAIFIELFKQINREKRQTIASVMDEFSKGFTIESGNYIFREEILNFSKNIVCKPWKDVSAFRTISEEKIIETLKWKRTFASQNPLPSLCELATSEIVGNINQLKNISNGIANHLQEQKEKYDSEARQFKIMQAVEIGNTIESVFKIFPDLKSRMSGVSFPEVEKNIHLKMPAIWSFGSIHSLLRNDSKRKYRVNDFFDIEHCSVALGYYDYFFTERSFFNVVTHKLAELDKRFRLFCAKKYDDANKILLEIVNST